MTRVLGGDIGGTKTILRLVERLGDNVKVIAEEQYDSQLYHHLNPIIENFLKGDENPIDSACFAIAGPVADNKSQLTNLSWELDASQISTHLNIPSVSLINDFAAVGYGILCLQSNDLDVIQERTAQPEAPIAILGAGTGLGEALMVWSSGRYEVIPTEGGHADFAPSSDLEIGLLKYLRQRHGHVSVERVVSGQGIYAIYEFLRDTQMFPENLEVRSQLETTDTHGAVISQYGLSGQDEMCETTLNTFVSAYGAEAGNIALKSLAYGGVYLAGGIAAKLGEKMHSPLFINSFLGKGRMRPLLEKMPVSIITNLNVGLMGAVYYAQRDLTP
ncbi:MAG: glucokinase [Acaryochloridaceae cyanobacterium RL_2_7]|nr:glucokinase [Acaryochloridaceae cyanobacterium RL_2_7]